MVVGVTKDYQRIGLQSEVHVDTSAIRKAIEKYIDGDFITVAAEHEITLEGDTKPKRFGLLYFCRRAAQPVLAAIDGNIPAQKTPLFRQGDILIRRGAQSIRANAGEVRRLLTSTVVSAERVEAVREVWTCLVLQRRLMTGLEFVYSVLAESEYPDAISRPELRSHLGRLTEGGHARKIEELQMRVTLVRPYLSDEVYRLYRACAAITARIQMKTIQQRENGTLRAWTQLQDGSPDQVLRQMAEQMLPDAEVQRLWSGLSTASGYWRPLTPAIDAVETSLLGAIRSVLSGLA